MWPRKEVRWYGRAGEEETYVRHRVIWTFVSVDPVRLKHQHKTPSRFPPTTRTYHGRDSGLSIPSLH